MKRILLTVAYEGTHYHGWQVQPGEVTIEGMLNEALCDLTGEDIAVAGASRTDAGVHALGNLAVFDTDSQIPAEKFIGALNARLPEDIRILRSLEVAVDFHPRYQKSEKTYEYRIFLGKVENPIGRQYAHYVYDDLDIPAMEQAAGYLVGEHDFKSFCVAKAQVKTTVRTIYEVALRQEGPYLIIKVRGNGFLFNMIRIIAGTLLEVGRGRYAPEHVADILAACDRSKAGPTAPARGLTLVEIKLKEQDSQ